MTKLMTHTRLTTNKADQSVGMWQTDITASNQFPQLFLKQTDVRQSPKVC